MTLVIGGVITTGILTNITLRSIEKNLPITLLGELNDLSLTLESLAEAVNAAERNQVLPNPENFHLLQDKVEGVYNIVFNLRESYVFDNLVKASAFHAVVAPAIADLRIWLSEGISGYGPQTEITASIVLLRIQEAYQKARTLTRESKDNAREILEKQKSRLDRYLLHANLFFILAVVITLSMVYLLFYQYALQKSESKAQLELRHQRDLLNSLFDNVLLGITVWKQTGELLLLNKNFTEITGFSEADVPTLEAWFNQAFPDPATRQQVLAQWEASSRRENAWLEFRATCKNGAVKDFEYRGTSLPDGRKLVTISDITERKRTARMIRENQKIKARSRKMESLGLLAGGVAHDLNNILSGIVSYPDLILPELPRESTLRKPIQTMQKSGQRAAEIVLDLLTVARGVATAKEPVNLNDLVGEYTQSPEFAKLRKLHDSIAIQTDFDDNLLNISGSQVHIRKVIMNLVANAAEAIEHKGTITIATLSRYVDKPFSGYDNCQEGEYAVLSVADDGTGIEKDDLNRIFEPFYTRKVMGRSGTGLGLAVVWNVVQDHGGFIDIKSESSGTRFDLYFPVTREAVSARQIEKPLAEYKGDGETILVVDDVASQREIAVKMMEKLGYSAAAVSSGEEAVDYLRQHDADLLLLDMIMDPGINGRLTYERILAFKPGQKAIIASGFAETGEVKKAQQLGAGRFIRKPFSLEIIGLAVKEELERIRDVDL